MIVSSKKLVAALALAAQVSGCTFAVKHPPAAAAITGAVVGFSACEVDGASNGTCAIIGGGAAALLGLTALLALALAPDDDSPEVTDPITPIPMDNDRPVHVPQKQTPPPPPPKPLENLPPPPPEASGSAASPSSQSTPSTAVPPAPVTSP